MCGWCTDSIHTSDTNETEPKTKKKQKKSEHRKKRHEIMCWLTKIDNNNNRKKMVIFFFTLIHSQCMYVCMLWLFGGFIWSIIDAFIFLFYFTDKRHEKKSTIISYIEKKYCNNKLNKLIIDSVVECVRVLFFLWL